MALAPLNRMAAVELVEDDHSISGPARDPLHPGGLPSPDDLSHSPRSRGAGRAALRWWPVAVPVVLALAVGSALSARGESDRLERLAAVPGLLRPLDGAPVELWRHPVGAGSTAFAAGGGLAVLSGQDGSWQVTSFDARTGAERWATRLVTGSTVAAEAQGPDCPSASADVGAYVVCLVRTPPPVYADAEGPAAAPARVVALDSADGSVAGEWEVADEVALIERRGDDVVLVTEDSDGFFRAALRDPLTGAAVWEYKSRQSISSDVYVSRPTAVVTPEHVLLGGYGTAVLDAQDGAELYWATNLAFVLARSDGERFGTWSTARGGALHGSTGRRLRDMPSLPARPPVDDGTADDLVLLDAGREISAATAFGGEQLWTIGTDLDPAVIVDGQLILAAPGRQLSVDAHSGEVAWDIETDLSLPPVSDGSLVLTAELGVDGGPVLVARGITDGVSYWSTPLPHGTTLVSVEGGNLLAWTADELVVLG